MKFTVKKNHKKNRRKAWTRRPRYWVAMGTLAAYTALGTKTPVLAQTGRGRASQSPARAGSLPAVRFDIPAGPLDTALRSFENATGLQVKTPNEGVRTLLSPGVSGIYPVEEGLRRLLAGTGIAYRFTAPKVVTLELQAAATSVEVTADISDLAASTPKYAGPILNTPQSISVVPQQVMAQQGTTTLRDALRNVAGISLAAGEGGSQGDNLTIRGFSARNDLFIDGMRDFGSYYRDPFNTQEVDVLQGPSSVTFGRGSTGGVVNQGSKVPSLLPVVSGEADFGTDATRRVTLDLNAPLRKLGPGAAFRLNLMGDIGNVAGRDVAENRRFGVAPSLALGLNTTTRWNFSYFHQTADDIPDYGIPWLFNGPAPVNRENYYGFRDANFLRTYDDIGTVRVEHDVNAHVAIRNQVRYANYVRDAQITEPRVANASLDTPLTDIAVTRNQISVNSTETYLDEQLDVTANFSTGLIQHTLVTGVEAGRETSDPTRIRFANVPDASLLNPDPDEPFTGIPTISSIVHTTAHSASAYALETMKFGRHLELTGGLRWDRFSADYTQSVAPGAAYDRTDEMPTWRAAAVYKPVDIGSIYFSAGTSFDPSAESLSLNASSSSLPPEKNRNYEFGTKWDLNHGRLSLRAAIFRTEKANAREPDPNNPALNVLAGNQKVDGFEVEARGRLTSRWEMLSSYAYLDSRVVSSNYYPAAIGGQLANVPKNTFNLWNDYRLPGHWEGGLGGNYVSSRTASSTSPIDPVTGLVKQVPGYWVFNAMARHPLTEHIDFQVNVYNLANRYYYDELHPGHIVLGPGRSALIGFHFKF